MLKISICIILVPPNRIPGWGDAKKWRYVTLVVALRYICMCSIRSCTKEEH